MAIAKPNQSHHKVQPEKVNKNKKPARFKTSKGNPMY